MNIENKELGLQIKCMSFIASLCVIMIHCFAIANITTENRGVVFQQWFCHVSLWAWAVPLFFMVSGFWFAQSKYCKGMISYSQFILKKIRTLGMPYVLFILGGGIVSMPKIIYKHRLGELFFPNENIVSFEVLDNLFSFTDATPLFNGSMWYVRTLLIIFAVAPLWKWLYAFNYRFFLLIGLGGVLFQDSILNWTWLDLGGRVWYFFIGLWLSHYWDEHKFETLIASKKTGMICAVFYIVWALWDAMVVAYNHGNPLSLSIGMITVCNILRFFAIMSAIIAVGWGTYMVRCKWPLLDTRKEVGWSFMIYGLHYILFIPALSILHVMLGKHGVSTLLNSCVLVVYLYCGTYWTCRVLTTAFPKLAEILSGGRC